MNDDMVISKRTNENAIKQSIFIVMFFQKLPVDFWSIFGGLG